ncbi:hypothetical protein GCM10010451_38090 [Streptomyces virens]|uniref:Transposase n=1 Tax=Streptomyces virens TaxID=285572 RepID=A0ABP6PPM7_9ACTN|nr:hypothetical protein [Streptomyces sp. SID7804]
MLRLLSSSHRASAADILEHSVEVRRRMEVVTAGVVLIARRRIPWESLGRILSIGPETARHAYHERLVQRRLDDYAPPPGPHLNPGGHRPRRG